jgi:hypothetical protein
MHGAAGSAGHRRILASISRAQLLDLLLDDLALALGFDLFQMGRSVLARLLVVRCLVFQVFFGALSFDLHRRRDRKATLGRRLASAFSFRWRGGKPWAAPQGAQRMPFLP